MILSIIIPVYNEIETIEQIIKKILAVDIEKEIIIVDDGSTDGSGEYLRKLHYENIKVIFHKKNQGKGAAVKTGIENVSGDYLLVQDADLEYNPQDYKKLIAPIIEKKAQVVYGSRFKGGGKMFFKQYIGNKFLTYCINLLYGSKLSDLHTCYKLIPKSIAQSFVLREKGFGFDTEVTARLLKKKIAIYEVPISFAYRESKQGKKISYLKDGFKSLWILIKIKLGWS